MTSSHNLPKSLIIFGLIIPLAALVGYVLANPENLVSIGVVGSLALLLISPLLLRWHHQVLVVTWNMAITVFFLPGQPLLWMLFAVSSLMISFLNWLLTKQKAFLHVPSVTWSLAALAIVTIMTAKLTGGIGIRALGSDTYGGKQYLLILLAIIGFFALAFQSIPPAKGKTMVSLFFLSGVTPVVSNLAYLGGPAFYFLYWFFPVGYAGQQVLADWRVGGGLSRLAGFSAAGMAMAIFLLQRYGLRGIVAPAKPWRWLLFLGLLFLTLMGGFRGSLVILAVLLLLLFMLEKLYRTRLMIGAIVVSILASAFLMMYSERLPLSIQRSLSILPIKVDPIARYDAEVTTEWRLTMWKYLLPQVPQYLIRPKGYALDPTELYLVGEGVRRGLVSDIDSAIASGSYHSGPLSLVLGLGIWGVIAFAWFIAAGLRVLYRNYRYGPDDLRIINTLLLAYFSTRLIFYLVVFGHFSDDLVVFTGIVGLSLSVNGGMRKPAEQLASAPAMPSAELQPLPT